MSAYYLTYLNISFNFLTTLEKFVTPAANGNNFQMLKILDANANRIESINITSQ